jgi:VWFA-related protein
MLVEFDEGVSLLNDFTTRTSEIVAEIDRLRAGGGTALWDALYVVSGEKMTGRGARKAIVVLSDGEDLNSTRSFDDTLRMIQSSEVTVYPIGTSRFGASSSKKGEDNLVELADESGGTAFFPYSAELLESAFDQINAELRSQYSLTYSPRDKTRDGRFRKIEVRIENGDGLKLRYRRGYRLPDF